LFRMLYGFCPFESNNIGKLIMIIEEEDIKIPEQPRFSPEVIKLIRRMITKNPKLRAEWSEVFAYEVKNGELVRQGIRERTPRSNALKRSFTMSETTSANSMTNLPPPSNDTSFTQNKQGSDLIYNPRTVNSELRNTYTAKSPLR